MSPRQTLSLVDTLFQLLFRFIVNTLYGAYLPRSYVGSDGFLRQHFPENVCAVPNMAVFCLLLLFTELSKICMNSLTESTLLHKQKKNRDKSN